MASANPCSAVQGGSDDPVTWFTFYSHREKREYYYEPISGTTTWVAPSQNHGIISHLPGSPDEVELSSAGTTTATVDLSSWYQQRVIPFITRPPVAFSMLVFNLLLLFVWFQTGPSSTLGYSSSSVDEAAAVTTAVSSAWTLPQIIQPHTQTILSIDGSIQEAGDESTPASAIDDQPSRSPRVLVGQKEVFTTSMGNNKERETEEILDADGSANYNDPTAALLDVGQTIGLDESTSTQSPQREEVAIAGKSDKAGDGTIALKESALDSSHGTDGTNDRDPTDASAAAVKVEASLLDSADLLSLKPTHPSSIGVKIENVDEADDAKSPTSVLHHGVGVNMASGLVNDSATLDDGQPFATELLSEHLEEPQVEARAMEATVTSAVKEVAVDEENHIPVTVPQQEGVVEAGPMPATGDTEVPVTGGDFVLERVLADAISAGLIIDQEIDTHHEVIIRKLEEIVPTIVDETVGGERQGGLCNHKMAQFLLPHCRDKQVVVASSSQAPCSVAIEHEGVNVNLHDNQLHLQF